MDNPKRVTRDYQSQRGRREKKKIRKKRRGEKSEEGKGDQPIPAGLLSTGRRSGGEGKGWYKQKAKLEKRTARKARGLEECHAENDCAKKSVELVGYEGA